MFTRYKMDVSTIRASTVCNLQNFLKERGISAQKLNKGHLVRLCEAVLHLDLPKNPEYINISSTNDVIRKLDALGCKDPLTMDGFSNTLSDIPNITLYDVFNYLITSRSDYDRKKLKAYKSCEDYRLYFDGHVDDLEYHGLSKEEPLCLFRAKVKPTQRDKTYLNESYYKLWICIGKQHGNVRSAYCTCIGGADGACRHIAAVLYEIEAYDEKSSTDGENKWIKRPRHHDCPVPIKRLKIMKAKYHQNAADVNNNYTNDEFDPRAVVEEMNDEKLDSFYASLQKIDPNTQALDLLESKFDESDVRKTNDDQCVMWSICEKSVNFLDEKKLNYQSVDEVPDSLCDTFLENIHASEEDIQYVESHTYGQSDNSNWHVARKGMITASNFKKVCDCVAHKRNPNYLKKLLLGAYSDAKSASLAWGVKKERCAINLYKRVAGKKHIGMDIKFPGLRIFKDKPYLGCSVDGLLTCKCKHHGGTKIIEIKCPYSDREKLPKEVALLKGCVMNSNGNLQLTQSSDYYPQIQGQMGIYNCQFADLIIYTKQGIHVVEDIVYDEKYFSDMIEKLEMYFKNILLKTMFVNCNKTTFVE
ncbi:uncharacterized protein LOC125652255 [Ostrea edulis]|uniref:uncharacterized protein LOC125652255 n=1 Tax=Ostrea edulis TaxID=37623 RepID=UPI0024AF4D99|nr:uncharacterized protein LOC125652255 [Ostrea edulis]